MSITEINIDTWKRKKNFLWFREFPNPCFGLTSRMDVTEVLKYSKEHSLSSFSVICFVLSEVLNGIEDFKYRVDNGKPVYCDRCNIAYTVATAENEFTNCRTLSHRDFSVFYPAMRADIEAIKQKKEEEGQEGEFNNVQILDDFYFSCVKWLDFTACVEPIPGHLPENYSIPRICWGKYVEENGRMKMSLSITVNHSLIDGYAVSVAFNRIQEAFGNIESLIEGKGGEA